MLEREKVRSSKYYSIGYSPSLKKYILSSVVTWIAWYNRYFEITQEEYNFSETNVDLLDEIAHQCQLYGVLSGRFICSDKTEENQTEEQKTAWKQLSSDVFSHNSNAEIARF